MKICVSHCLTDSLKTSFLCELLTLKINVEFDQLKEIVSNGGAAKLRANTCRVNIISISVFVIEAGYEGKIVQV